MKTRKTLTPLLSGLLILITLVATSCAPAPAATQVPVKAAFDIKLPVQNFLTTLPEGFYGIKPADALQALQAEPKPMLVDLREAKEITPEAGYLTGAVHIPFRSLLQNLDKLPALDKPVIFYCASGHRGGMAVETLRMLGYTNVKSISGGLNAWKTANLPIAKDGIPATATTLGTKTELDPELLAALDKYLASMPDDFYGLPAANALKEMQSDKKPFLVDVRDTKELTDSGTLIEGAINIPIRDLLKDLSKLPQDKAAPIVAYCAVGHRGAMAVESLRLLGYTNVRSIGGGFNSWVKANLPTVKCPTC
jgi:rhodanese-related sulfurtransferase